MPGTRDLVVDRLVNWVKNGPHSTFWLFGAAGVGKTFIAATLSRQLQDDPHVLLGGTFFCSSTPSELDSRADAWHIVPSLVAQAANQFPQFAEELVAQLNSNSDILQDPVDVQMGPLLQKPLAQLASENRPVLFVMDAIDECGNQDELLKILQCVATFRWPARVKFIITSRPETQIIDIPTSHQTQNDILQLHQMEAEEINEGIRLYIDRNFSQHSLASEIWYSDANLRKLAAFSRGSFFFASTITTYILDAGTVDNREARLRTVLLTMKEDEETPGLRNGLYDFVHSRATTKSRIEPHELASFVTSR